MTTIEKHRFSLDNFEGSLDLLILLVKNEEVDVGDVSVKDVVRQYITSLAENEHHTIDDGGLFLSLATLLLVLKSRKLLPSEGIEPLDDDILADEDNSIALAEHLLEYYRFKKMAKNLSEKENEREGIFPRMPPPPPSSQHTMGIDHLSLNDLATVFHKILLRSPRQLAEERYREEWTITQKIAVIQDALRIEKSIPLTRVLSYDMFREEIIAAFLALLELLKNGNIFLTGDVDAIENLKLHTKEQPQ